MNKLSYVNFNETSLLSNNLPLQKDLLDYNNVSARGLPIRRVARLSQVRVKGSSKAHQFLSLRCYPNYGLISFYAMGKRPTNKLNWTNFKYDKETNRELSEVEAKSRYQNYIDEKGKIYIDSKKQIHSKVYLRLSEGLENIRFIFFSLTYFRSSDPNARFFVGSGDLREKHDLLSKAKIVGDFTKVEKIKSEINKLVDKYKSRNPYWCGNFFIEPTLTDVVWDVKNFKSDWKNFVLRLGRYVESLVDSDGNRLNPSFSNYCYSNCGSSDCDFGNKFDISGRKKADLNGTHLKESLCWFQATEPQKDGTPHGHVALKYVILHGGECLAGFSPSTQKVQSCWICANILTSLWMKGMTDVRELDPEKYGNFKKVVSYISKYATKGSCSKNSLKTSSDSGISRTYSFSGNFPYPICDQIIFPADSFDPNVHSAYEFLIEKFALPDRSNVSERVRQIPSSSPHSSDPANCQVNHDPICSNNRRDHGHDSSCFTCHTRLLPTIAVKVLGQDYVNLRLNIWPNIKNFFSSKGYKSSCSHKFCLSCGVNFKISDLSLSSSDLSYVLVHIYRKGQSFFYKYYSDFSYCEIFVSEFYSLLNSSRTRLFWNLKPFIREYGFLGFDIDSLDLSRFIDLSLLSYHNKKIIENGKPFEHKILDFSSYEDFELSSPELLSHNLIAPLASAENYNYGDSLDVSSIDFLASHPEFRRKKLELDLSLLNYLDNSFSYKFVENIPSNPIYLAFDVETTGLTYHNETIIEIAFYNENYKFESFVFCDTVSQFITNLTGISNSMLSSAPTPVEVCKKIVDFLSSFDRKVILVAHNAPFDFNFLEVFLSRYGFPSLKTLVAGLYDTIYLLPNSVISRDLSTAIKHFNIASDEEMRGHHRAMFDAVKTYELFKVLDISPSPRSSLDIELSKFLIISRSPKKLKFFIKDILGISSTSFTKQIILEYLPIHPIFSLILDAKNSSKSVSVYSKPLLDAFKSKSLYTTFINNFVATGRLSSRHPNLQNLTRDIKDDFKTEKHNTASNLQARAIRSCYKSKPNYSFLFFDYSQQEYRCAGYVSRDPVILEAYARGEDLHTLTVEILNSVGFSINRDQAKTINFGILYGMSIRELARRLRASRVLAGDIFKTILGKYPVFSAWCKENIKVSWKKGYIETFGGFKRFIEISHFSCLDFDISKSSDRGYSPIFERHATNTVIQGTCAEITKHAIVASYNWIKKSSYAVRFVHTIHDELIFEVHESLITDMNFLRELKSVIELSCPFPWNMPVELNYGYSFAKSFHKEIKFA